MYKTFIYMYIGFCIKHFLPIEWCGWWCGGFCLLLCGGGTGGGGPLYAWLGVSRSADSIAN